MSSLSGISGGSSSAAWTGVGASRSAAMKERMFARIDADGSGGIDKTELADMLAKIQKQDAGGSTTSVPSAEDALAKLDANADGSLDADEMEGLRDLMPPPSSTVAFAQGRTGGAEGNRPPPPPGGPRGPGGPGGAAEAEASSETADRTALDPLDTNEDGTVSAEERAVGELSEMIKSLAQGIDSDGDGRFSDDEVTSFAKQLVSQAMARYGQMASGSESTGSVLAAA